MKKILTLILCLTSIVYLSSCASINQFEYGDFVYDEVSGISYVIDVAEEAKEKTHLVVPRTVKDLNISIGRLTVYGHLIGTIKSDYVEKVYIFTENEFHAGLENQHVPSLQKIFCFYIQGISFDFEKSEVFLGTYGPSYNENFYPNNKNSFYANVSYQYHYDGAPDEGYYFIDDYDDELINYIPEDPVREEYLFLGLN
jgi:hypothetical protein